MLSLAKLLFDKNDLQMAKIWYDRACESGNIVAQINRDNFEKDWQQTQQVTDRCSPNTLKIVNVMKNIYDSLMTNKTVYSQSDQPMITY